MARVNDKQIAIAQVYSRSLLELAEQRGETENLLSELSELVSLMAGKPEVVAFFDSPLVDSEKRAGSLETMFRGKASDLLVDTLQVLNRKGRLQLLPAIAQLFREGQQARAGKLDVEVASAVPLSDALRQQIRDRVKQLEGKAAVLHESVESSLLGGMVLRFGDTKIDTSVANQLRNLGKTLEERHGTDLQDRVLAPEA